MFDWVLNAHLGTTPLKESFFNRNAPVFVALLSIANIKYLSFLDLNPRFFQGLSHRGSHKDSLVENQATIEIIHN